MGPLTLPEGTPYCDGRVIQSVTDFGMGDFALRLQWRSATLRRKGQSMSITVEATYENGTLRLSQPLPLKEQERVQVTIHETGNPVQQSAGLIPCSDPVLIERIALDPLEDV